jgi:hypothetical protein
VCVQEPPRPKDQEHTRNLNESTRVFADVNAENFVWRRDGCVSRDKEGSRKDEAWTAPCSRNVLDLVKKNAVVGKLRRKEGHQALSRAEKQSRKYCRTGDDVVWRNERNFEATRPKKDIADEMIRSLRTSPTSALQIPRFFFQVLPRFFYCQKAMPIPKVPFCSHQVRF